MGWFEERGELTDTVSVIPGGAGGLGAAIATDLAANGVRVAVLDIEATAARRPRWSSSAARSPSNSPRTASG